jgi:type I restriction enzyme S subunit
MNLSSLDKSTTIPGLNREIAYSQRILLPPLEEQYRIVVNGNYKCRVFGK